MKASGRYDERIDAQMSSLYAGRFGSPAYGAAAMPARGADAPHPDADFYTNNASSALQDDVEADEALPFTARARSALGAGTVLRVGHALPRLPAPPKAARLHDSKFVFRDISGRARSDARLLNPLLTSDWSGASRAATNTETLYRSWAPRYWTVDRASPKSAKNYPFADEDADKPRAKDGWRVPP